MAEETTGGIDPYASPEEPRRPKITKITPEGLPTFYANNVAFRTLFWDFTLDFGQVVEASDEGLVIRDVATVVLAPQHARVFAEVLLRNIAQYEEQFGPIPRPPEADTGAGEPAGE